MLVTTQTGGTFREHSNIKKETFDSFLLKGQQIHKEAIQKALERYDKDIYTEIDQKQIIFNENEI